MTNAMQRLIRSFNTLTDGLREQLQEQYPDGIDNNHIRTIATAKGESLRVIELRTSDAIYLIKINADSRQEIDEFLDQEEPVSAGEDIESDEIETPDSDGTDDAGEKDDDFDKDDDGDEEEVKEKDEDEDED